MFATSSSFSRKYLYVKIMRDKSQKDSCEKTHIGFYFKSLLFMLSPTYFFCTYSDFILDSMFSSTRKSYTQMWYINISTTTIRYMKNLYTYFSSVRKRNIKAFKAYVFFICVVFSFYSYGFILGFCEVWRSYLYRRKNNNTQEMVISSYAIGFKFIFEFIYWKVLTIQ